MIKFRTWRWEMVLDDPGGPGFIARVLKCERRRQQSHNMRKTRWPWLALNMKGPRALTVGRLWKLDQARKQMIS